MLRHLVLASQHSGVIQRGSEVKMKTIKEKYWNQKAQAKKRGIDFNLTFSQWWDIWEKSGKWEQRGRKKGQYVMSRVGDMGPYELGNVFIQSNANNNRDAAPNRVYSSKSFINRVPWNLGKKTGSLSEEHKQKLSNTLKGVPKPQRKVTCPHCNLTGGISNMTRKHFSNCKHKETIK